MYLSFTLTILFGISFVIVNSQPIEVKELFQSITFAVGNLLVNFLIYGQKAIRIILYPKQNTKAYFRQQQLKHMQQTVFTEAIELN